MRAGVERFKAASGVTPTLPGAVELIGEKWAFLILRGALNGLHHFEEFQATLGIARNILSNRLGRLVENGILAREPDPADRRKVAYRLTEKGASQLAELNDYWKDINTTISQNNATVNGGGILRCRPDGTGIELAFGQQ